MKTILAFRLPLAELNIAGWSARAVQRRQLDACLSSRLKAFWVTGSGVVGAIARFLLVFLFVRNPADYEKADDQNDTGNKCEQNVHLKGFDGSEINHPGPYNEDGDMNHHRIFFGKNSFFNLLSILNTQYNQDHQES